ncbi:MAG: DUF5050 domain-containing protein [Bacillus sp. (in: Bacteria)]|nr:DUF5050 domain-containing protein [Bacillus sp. (in: firmicutes)]MCM1427087.1 DUF5050 domain-containing protein [Eubacterium sp.]
MTAKTKNIIIISSIFAILAIIVTVLIITSRMPMNNDYTVGNTAGNLNNGGLFCESDGRVYFANAYDNNTLYSMNPDETDIQKIGVNSVASINAGGDYLYYYMESGGSDGGEGLGYMGRTAGIYRSLKNGKKTKCLDRTYAVTMQLCGNYLYYQDYNNKTGTQLTKIKIDKSDKVTVADYVINPASYVNGYIYFNGTQDDHALYTLNTANDSIASLWEGNIWNPVYMDGYVYYMDVANDYRLCRYSLSQNVIEVLTNDRVDFFNVYYNYIYYQKSSQTEPALKRMNIDGSNPEIVASGVYENINITSQYVYFNQYGASVPVFRTSTTGPVNVTPFNAASNAAAQNIKK